MQNKSDSSISNSGAKKNPKSGQKRKRDKSDISQDPIKNNKVALSNKERAQRSRDRKKQYTSMLEMKIKLLEEQVKILNLELERYQKKEMFEQITNEDIKRSENSTVINESLLQNVLTCLKHSEADGKLITS